MSTTIKLRRGTSTAFSTNNPTLQAGEPAFETDTGKLKIGDGTTAYNSLAYIGDGLKNNSTANNSLAILGTATGANNTVIGSGSNCYHQTGNTIVGVSSTASGSGGNILIGNNNTGYQNTIVIGNSQSTSSSDNAIRIGNNGSVSGSNQGVSIGYGARCVSANHGVAIGYNAEARNWDAIQLGTGSNTTASTLKFMSYQLVNSSGKIPNDRLNIDSAPASASTNTVTSGGVYTALDGKADTDLSNVTDTGYIKMAGASMPSSRYIDLALGASETIYATPANGWVCIAGRQSAPNGWVRLTTSSFLSSWQQPTTVANFMIATFIPVRGNSTFRLDYSDVAFEYFRFIYAVGSESEWVNPNA